MVALLDYPELKNKVNNHRFLSGTRLEFENFIYHVFTIEHTKQDQKNGYDPAFWKSGSSLGDFDIYIPEKIFSKRVIIPFRRPILFHEVAESYLHTRFRNSEIGLKSHDLARSYEDQYITETFDEKTIKTFLELRKQIDKSRPSIVAQMDQNLSQNEGTL